ncbi:Hypothetical predicted protein [Octopus vulgaris]|uniref:Uncharacterized protein n=1 Tax=Octopus vulgaris TaxID=6645 RepID=A0AA36B2V1_OCTVU|nr:Hypothetical predicted protein [Octopus vulgaris]
MQPHIANTKITTVQAHEEREKVLNAHMMMWTIVLGPQKRTANNFQAWNNDIPALYGLRKDHKVKSNQVHSCVIVHLLSQNIEEQFIYHLPCISCPQYKHIKHYYLALHCIDIDFENIIHGAIPILDIIRVNDFHILKFVTL